MAKAQQPSQQPQEQGDKAVEQLKAMGVPQDKVEQAQQQLKQRGLNFGGLIQTILSNLPALLKFLDELKSSSGSGSGGTDGGQPPPPAE